MRFLDILLGRQRPVPSKLEALFALTTAEISLEARANLRPGNHAGICFRPVTSSRFQNLSTELRELLAISGRETGTKIETTEDGYGFQWVVLEDEQLEDLVATIHMVSQTLQEQGFGDQLLAAVFQFLQDSQPAYWIYNYKRGTFYPFVPKPKERERDNARELQLRSLMEKELPIEPELERWYPLWGMPF